MKSDAKNYDKKCDQCQRHAPIPNLPSNYLSSVTNPWSFAQWGRDIVDPLSIDAAPKKLLLVATNYFRKLVKAKAYVSIKDKDVTKFFWKNIVCQFGVPRAIITDNGLQFNNNVFRAFYSEFNITNLYSTSRYP